MAVNFQKWFKKDNLLILILSGVLLFVIALPTGKNSDMTEKNKSSGKTDTAYEEQAAGATEEFSETEYVAGLEKRLEQLIGSMEGVGTVQVMITLRSSKELVVEKDTPNSHSSTSEEDAAGGSRLITEWESREETVYRDAGGGEPYVIKTLTPQIEGVVVAAQGAEGTVLRNISELVQALFGLEANHVKVVKMSSQNQIDR